MEVNTLEVESLLRNRFYPVSSPPHGHNAN